MDPLTTLAQIPGIGPYLSYLIAAGVICGGVATFLPPPTNPGSLYGQLYSVVNWLGLNFGHARNAGAPTAAKPPSAPLSAILAMVGLALMLDLAGCMTPQQTQGVAALAPAARQIAGDIDPASVAKYDAACPTLQKSVSAAVSIAASTGLPAEDQQKAVNAKTLIDASCANKAQLAANDAAPVGPSNSGNSLAWMNTLAAGALAVARVAVVVAPLL